MSTLNLLSLGLILIVFVAWCFLMFRMLWRLTLRSRMRLEETGGGFFRWMGHSLSTFLDFATSEPDRAERRRLIWLTVLLFATIIAQPLILLAGK